jgi:probable F420-dependent oxidoreductase
MTMKLGIRIPQRLGVSLRTDIVDAARTAEAIGYQSLWTYERVLTPLRPKESYPYSQPGFEDAPWPEAQRQAADALAILAAAAAVTSRVRLGTSVLIASAHAPFQLAKSMATIDQISGGRLIAGLGAGWSTDELQTNRAVRADRGRHVDEMLDVFSAVWGPDPVNHHSARTVIEDAIVLPKPVSSIPVLLAGDAGASAVFRRITTRGDGWLSVAAGAGGLQSNAQMWNRIREAAAGHGRTVERMQHVVVANITLTERPQGTGRIPFVGTLDEVIEDIATADQLGADEISIDLNLQDWFTDTARMLDTAAEIFTRAMHTAS